MPSNLMSYRAYPARLPPRVLNLRGMKLSVVVAIRSTADRTRLLCASTGEAADIGLGRVTIAPPTPVEGSRRTAAACGALWLAMVSEVQLVIRVGSRTVQWPSPLLYDDPALSIICTVIERVGSIRVEPEVGFLPVVESVLVGVGLAGVASGFL